MAAVLALTGPFPTTDAPSGALKPVSDVDAVGSQAEAQVGAHASEATRYLVIGTPLSGNPNVTVIPTASATAASVESAVLHIVGS